MSYPATKRAYVLRKTTLLADKKQKLAGEWLKQEDMRRQDDKSICVQLTT